MEPLKSDAEGPTDSGRPMEPAPPVSSEAVADTDTNVDEKGASTTDESGDEDEQPIHNELTQKKRVQNAKFEALSVHFLVLFLPYFERRELTLNAGLPNVLIRLLRKPSSPQSSLCLKPNFPQPT